MTVPDKFSYYSKTFNIICECTASTSNPLYQLTVIIDKEAVEVVEELTEEELKTTLEDLKTKYYLK
jgi:hypothetical protein